MLMAEASPCSCCVPSNRMSCGQSLLLLSTLLWLKTAAVQDLICAPGNNAITATARFMNVTFDEIIQPNFPDGHAIMKCTWILTAVEPTQRVKIVIKTLSLSDEGDRLHIYDGDSMDDKSRIGIFGPCAKGTLIIYSTGTSMTIVLVSNSNAGRGRLRVLFKALPRDWITCEAKDPVSDLCTFQTNINKRSGYVTSPGFPANFSSAKSCTWTFNIPEGYRMQISFEWMGIRKEKGRRCALDNMIRLSDSQKSAEYCGCDEIPVMDSSRTMWLKLLAAPMQYWSGFMLTHRAVPLEDCPIGRTDCLYSYKVHGFDKMGQLCSDNDTVPTTPHPTTISTPPPTVTTTLKTSKVLHVQEVKGTEESIQNTNDAPQNFQPYSNGGLEDKKFTVYCGKDYMLVTVSLERFEAQDRLDPDSLRLEDTSCKPYFINETLAIFRAPLEGCGTYHNWTKDRITYWNTINGYTEGTGRGVITRRYTIRLGFDCSYAKTKTMSVVSFSPRKKVVYTASDGRGNFTFMMDLYKSDQYRESFDRYPVPVGLNQRLFLQVLVKSKAKLVIFPDTCFATPTSNINDALRYDFIKQGCSRDSTLVFNYNLAPVQQFSIAAFRFKSITKNEVYIHCMVQVCMKANNKSVCAAGCTQRPDGSDTDSRKRRSSLEYAQGEQQEFLTLGPLQVKSEKPDFAPKEAIQSSSLVTAIVAGVLSLCIIGLTTVILSVLIKKTKRFKQTEVDYQIQQPRK